MGRNSKHDIVVIERGGHGLLWLLVGGVVGAGLGLLFAPHSGKRTRALLGDRLAALKEDAEDVLEKLDEAGEEGEEGEEGGNLGKDGEEDREEEEAELPRRSARAELERRLARARARRRRELAEEDEEPVA
jgi:gas vesicle protein